VIFLYILDNGKPPRGGDAKLWACSVQVAKLPKGCLIRSNRFEPQLHLLRGPRTKWECFVRSWGQNTEVGGLVMRRCLAAAVDFIEREDGPTAVEYAVMLALIIVVCLGAITTLGQNANGTFQNVALNAAVTSSASS